MFGRPDKSAPQYLKYGNREVARIFNLKIIYAITLAADGRPGPEEAYYFADLPAGQCVRLTTKQVNSLTSDPNSERLAVVPNVGKSESIWL